jgi:hypothetical protein
MIKEVAHLKKVQSRYLEPKKKLPEEVHELPPKKEVQEFRLRKSSTMKRP